MGHSDCSLPRACVAAVVVLAAGCLYAAAADTVTRPPGPAPATGLTAGGTIGGAGAGRPESLVYSPASGGLAGGRRVIETGVNAAHANRAQANAVRVDGRSEPGASSFTHGGAAEWAAQGGVAALLYGLSRKRRRRKRVRW